MFWGPYTRGPSILGPHLGPRFLETPVSGRHSGLSIISNFPREPPQRSLTPPQQQGLIGPQQPLMVGGFLWRRLYVSSSSVYSGPSEVLIQTPCPSDLSEILTAPHAYPTQQRFYNPHHGPLVWTPNLHLNSYQLNIIYCTK